MAVILLAVAEFVSRQLIVHDTLGAIVGVRPPSPTYRLNALRVMSTFEHPILLGAFCSVVVPVLLYWERKGLQRALWVGLCFVGCIVSLTSVALISFFLVLALYTYDRLLNRYSWRWNALWVALAVFLFAIYAATNAPLGWVLTHLTFDPESGYFRYLIWERGLAFIDKAPLAGYSFNLLHDDILNSTVDFVLASFRASLWNPDDHFPVLGKFCGGPSFRNLKAN